MRTLKWDPWFEPDIESTIGVAWISMPDLPPNFFARDAIFSIASAVGKPLTVDMATKNQTRSSCARVKVEVDLVVKLPQWIPMNEENDSTGEIKSKWVQIHYDYMPKYCKDCCLQGHDEASYWNIHPELYDKVKDEKEQNKQRKQQHYHDKARRGTTNNQQWITRRNRYRRDRYGHILEEVNDEKEKEIEVSISFDALEAVEDNDKVKKEEAEKGDHAKQVVGEKVSIKDCQKKALAKLKM